MRIRVLLFGSYSTCPACGFWREGEATLKKAHIAKGQNKKKVAGKSGSKVLKKRWQEKVAGKGGRKRWQQNRLYIYMYIIFFLPPFFLLKLFPATFFFWVVLFLPRVDRSTVGGMLAVFVAFVSVVLLLFLTTTWQRRKM